MQIIFMLLAALSLSVVVPEAHAAERLAGAEAFAAEVLARNPTLRARTLARDAFRREAAAAGIWPDPEAAVMLDELRAGSDIPLVRYQLSQVIPWPGKLRLMEAVANRRVDAARAEVLTQKLDLVRDAKNTYYLLLLNKGLLEVNSAARRLLDTIAKAALARYGSGLGQHHEVTRTEVERNAIDVEAIDLTGERVAIVALMNALRNLPAATAIVDPSEPAEGGVMHRLGLPRLERLALGRRPELTRLRAGRREEQTMAELARRERYPDLLTGITYTDVFGEPNAAGVVLGARLPLFGVTRQNRFAEAADLRASSVGSELAAVQAMIRFEVADAHRRVVTAEQTLAFVRDVAIPRARESLSASLAGYSTGTVDIFGVLDAWRTLQAVERARVESVAGRLASVADLERATGGPLTEGRL